MAEHWLKNLDDLVPLHRRYVQAVRDVAAEENAPLVDLYWEFNQLPERELKRFFKGDGIHSTPAGYRKVAELIDRLFLRMNLYQQIIEGEPLEERLQKRLDSARLVTSGRFDVWLHGNRLLYYVKDHCDDREDPFFLHIVPVDPNDLPEHRRKHGYDNRDFDFSHIRLDFMPRCVAVQLLPEHAVAAVRTGQYNLTKRSWEVEFHPATGADGAN